MRTFVIPAKAGIQTFSYLSFRVLDPGLRRGDEYDYLAAAIAHCWGARPNCLRKAWLKAVASE